MITTQKFFVCIVYVSEGVRVEVIQSLNNFAKSFPKTKFAHSFRDQAYNRTSFFFVSKPSYLLTDVLSFCQHAFSLVNYEEHLGSHPSLGAIDHICFSPLGGGQDESALEQTGEHVASFSQQLHRQENVPVFCYGYASSGRRELKTIRKELGYFASKYIRDEFGIYSGANIVVQMQQRAIAGPVNVPDFGSLLLPGNELMYKAKGITCCGAVPFVLNLNMRFRPIDGKASIDIVTDKIRSSKVQAMTLWQDGAFECACNLLRPRETNEVEVLRLVAEIIANEGLDIAIDNSYTTGLCEDQLLAMCTEEEDFKLDSLIVNDQI